MSARGRRWVGIVVLVTVAGAAWAVWAAKDDAKPGAGGPPGGMPPMPVEAAPVRVGAVIDEITTVGSLQANESVVIRAEIAQRIAAIDFTEGRAVKAGDVLVRLDATELAAQVAQNEAAAELARAHLERAKPLLAETLISPQAYDELNATLKEADATLAVARERLGKATIRAPFSGRLGLRQVSPGDYVQPGQALVNLEDVSSVKVDFRVPGVDVSRVNVRQGVTVRVDAFSGRTFPGRIEAIDPRLDDATRSVLVRARVPSPRGELLPGMFARVAVTVAERPNARWIPEQAVVPVGNDAFVFRVVDGKAAMVKIVIGQRRAGEAEVVSGVNPDDVVVIGGQMKLRDGAPVTVINRSGAPVGASPLPKS